MLVLVVPEAAQADRRVGQCSGLFWGLVTQSVCVTAVMGGKDYRNLSQWVGDVTVTWPEGGAHKLEVWGDGFYKSSYGNQATFTINKWVGSESGICGAVTDHYGSRQVACISIVV